MIKRDITFNFVFDPADKTWSVTTTDAPDALGIHEEAYEALLDCAYTLFDLAENPDHAAPAVQPIYHRLNLDFFPYFPYNEDEEDEEEERVLSPTQQERARRMIEGFRG